MSVALRKPMTREEFLDWEARQPSRYEFDGFQPVAMAGGTAAHAAIQRNLAIAVGGRLRGSPCQFFGSDLKVDTGETIRYPDGSVTCSAVPASATRVDDPVVIFEVMSDESAQDDMAGTMYERIGTDWVGHLLNASSTIRMPELDVDVALAEFYEGVDLTPAEPGAEQAD